MSSSPTCKKLHGQGLGDRPHGAQKLSRASAVLHELDPDNLSLRRLLGALAAQPATPRSPCGRSSSGPSSSGADGGQGKALVFIIDEVGQHVARSGDKIEDLRATVEEFGKVGKNLVKQRKIAAPCWIVVTSQEKLDEVVAAIDSKRIELAKLQDRFRYRVDLAPSDIREVATKRVLAKKPTPSRC